MLVLSLAYKFERERDTDKLIFILLFQIFALQLFYQGVLHRSLIFSSPPLCISRAIISPFLICAQEYTKAPEIGVTEKAESGREFESIDLFNKF